MNPSPMWARAMPPGPDTRIKITKEYAKHVARDAFFRAWPLVNVYNKRLGAEQSKQLAYAGPVPAAPQSVTSLSKCANARGFSARAMPAKSARTYRCSK